MATTNDVLTLCRERLADLLDRPVESIAADSPFAALGLDSAMAMHFVLEVEDRLGIELYPEVTGDYPDLATFTDYVAGLTAGA